MPCDRWITTTFAIAAAVSCVLVGSCARQKPVTEPEPDIPQIYELIGMHGHDLLCLPDPSAPKLRVCTTVAQLDLFMHSTRAN